MTWKAPARRAETYNCVGPSFDPDEPIDGLAPKNLRILETVYHEAALLASEDPSPPSPEELEDEAALAAFVAHLIGRPRRPI